ncbi:MAG: YbaY family lipoprotein [Cyanobacteria bacterium P01_H01_bin.105]
MTVLRNAGYILLFGLTAAMAISDKAAAQEMTLVLCETNGTALRVYEKDGQVLMRAFNRRLGQVLMNDAETEIGITASGLEYTNLLGDLDTRLRVDTSTGNCGIQIEGDTENGTILINETATSVIGTVTYRARIGLQPGSVVKTMLVDLDRDTIVAEQTLVTTGQQVPIPFHLLYSANEINPGHRYGVSAEITVQDERRWSTSTDYSVITQGAPSVVEVVVEMAGAAVPGPAQSDQPTEPTNEKETLPDAVATAVKTTLRQELGEVSLQVENYSRETWSDGCLGLGGPAESCLAALTEGWRVEIIDTTTGESYIYRTNRDGTQVRQDAEQQ